MPGGRCCHRHVRHLQIEAWFDGCDSCHACAIDLRIRDGDRAIAIRFRFDEREHRRVTKARASRQRCGPPACARWISDDGAGNRRRARCSARWACASNARSGSTAGASSACRIAGARRARRPHCAGRRRAATRRRGRSARQPTDFDVSCSARDPRAPPRRSRRRRSGLRVGAGRRRRRGRRPGVSRRPGYRQPTIRTPIAPKAMRCAPQLRRVRHRRALRRIASGTSSASTNAWHVHALGRRARAHDVARAALIVATGAQERHVPFAGWDRPGVIGLAAATVLLKAQRMLPGRDVVVAGAGPLLLRRREVDRRRRRPRRRGRRRAAAARVARRCARRSRRAPISSRAASRWMRDAAKSRRPDAACGTRCASGRRRRARRCRHASSPLDRDGQPRSDGPLDRASSATRSAAAIGLMPATDVTRLAGRGARVRRRRAAAGTSIVDDDQRCDRAPPVRRGRRRRRGGCGGGAVAGPHRGDGRGARPGRIDDARVRAARHPTKREARTPRGALRRRDDAPRERRRRRASPRSPPATHRVPVRRPHARDARGGDRRRLRDAQRSQDRDALRHGTVRRPRLRGRRGAADRASHRPARARASARRPDGRRCVRSISTRSPATSTTKRCRSPAPVAALIAEMFTRSAATLRPRVIGAGIMGATAALRAAKGGMRVIVRRARRRRAPALPA